MLQTRFAFASAWLLITMFAMLPTALAGKPWYPYRVKLPAGQGLKKDENKVIDYTPLMKAGQDWSICAVFPHMKDS